MKKVCTTILSIMLIITMIGANCVFADSSSVNKQAGKEVSTNIEDSINEISISFFENYIADETSLSASKREVVTSSDLSVATLTATALSITGQGAKGKTFDITVPIRDGGFVDPVEKNGAYEVLSVLDLVDFIRIVLKEINANNLMYIDIHVSCEIGERIKLENFNTYWYRAFVGGHITLEEETTTEPLRSHTSSITRTYSMVNDILGDIIKEYIRIIAIQDYPYSINNSTGGFFYFTLGIKDKWTEYTPYGGSMVTTNGSSFIMNCGEINLSTPKGEYFSSMAISFSGNTASCSNPLSLGFNLNIPGTPFSITYTYSNHTYASGTSYYKTYPATTNKATQVGNIWAAPGYWLSNAAGANEDVGHHYTVTMHVNTDTAYQVLGTKSLNFKWDYHITGTGGSPVYGVAVSTPNVYNNITNTVSYTLVSAK